MRRYAVAIFAMSANWTIWLIQLTNDGGYNTALKRCSHFTASRLYNQVRQVTGNASHISNCSLSILISLLISYCLSHGYCKPMSHVLTTSRNKKLSYRRVTARCVLSVVILPITTQQCINYFHDKSWPNWWYEVGGLVGGNVSLSWTMCTQPWRDRVGSHCLRCHKQTDDGRIVCITCIPTTCCGEIF